MSIHKPRVKCKGRSPEKATSSFLERYTHPTGFYGGNQFDRDSFKIPDSPSVEIAEESLNLLLRLVRENASDTVYDDCTESPIINHSAENSLIKRIVEDAFEVMQRRDSSNSVRLPILTPIAALSTPENLLAFLFKHECKTARYK